MQIMGGTLGTSKTLTRRSLAKVLAASGAATGLTQLLHATGAPVDSASQPVRWQQVHPGVWRATIGTPEAYTPVSSRLVPPQIAGFERLPKVESIPMEQILKVRTRSMGEIAEPVLCS